MDFKYSEKELDALEEKAMSPNNVVICPRCGKEIVFTKSGNSYEVKCQREGCIKETVRGI